jgi:hypothetical protein
MQDLKFPIKFIFKISSLANDFTAVDVNNKVVAYVRQKMFKLKEDIDIYQDESKSRKLYQIKADKWIDFSTVYSFTDHVGQPVGKIGRKGWASLWKANYDIFDHQNVLKYHVQEENGWIKVIDSLFSEIPILGMLTGYFFNPSYLVANKQGDSVAKLSKEPSFWGRRFEVTKLMDLDGRDDDCIMLGLMMMILLERRRG